MILLDQKRTTALNFDHVYDLSLIGNQILATVDYDADRRPLEIPVGEYEDEETAKSAFLDLLDKIKPEIGMVKAC